MVYTTYYQGVQVTSNIPTDIGQPGNYDVKIYWSDNALGWIEGKAAEGFSALNNFTGQITTKIYQDFENTFGSNHISNINFNANNQYTEFSFTLASPSVFDWIGILIGAVIWGLALATAIIPGVDVLSIGSAIVYTFLTAVGVSSIDWFINKVDAVFTPIEKTVGTSGGSLIEVVIIGAVLIGLAYLGIDLYSKYKSGKNG